MKYFATCCFVILYFDVVGQSQLPSPEILYATENYSKAIEAYKNCKTCDPLEKYTKIAQAYTALGQYDKALKQYSALKDSFPENNLTTFRFAKLLLQTKQYQKAQENFESLIRLDSLNPNYHYHLGLVKEKLKDTSALHSFNRCFKIDDTHQKAIYKIAKHYLTKRQFKLAHQYIDTGLSTYYNNLELISLKAQTFYYQNNYLKAVTWFNKLISLGESSEFIHEKLSLSYAQNSDYKEAIYHRKQALKFNPHDADALYVIGSYYERLGDFEQAEMYITKALKILDQPLDNEYIKLGAILNRQKKHQQALKAFQKALQENPTNLFIEFYILITKESFYADKNEVIKLYEDYIELHKNKALSKVASIRLKKIKEKQFLDSKNN